MGSVGGGGSRGPLGAWCRVTEIPALKHHAQVSLVTRFPPNLFLLRKRILGVRAAVDPPTLRWTPQHRSECGLSWRQAAPSATLAGVARYNLGRAVYNANLRTSGGNQAGFKEYLVGDACPGHPSAVRHLLAVYSVESLDSQTHPVFASSEHRVRTARGDRPTVVCE